MKLGLKAPTISAPKYTPGIAPDYHVWQKIVDYKVTGSPATSLTFNLLDPEVVLLCHFDNDLKDRANHTLTAVNGASLDATQSKFGGYSLKLVSASSQYVSIPDSDDWYFGTGDFTIDFWMRISGSVTPAMGIMGQRVDDNNWWSIYKATGGSELGMFFVIGGVTKAQYYTNDLSLAADTWYHIVFERTSTTARFFIDGVEHTLVAATAFGTNDVGNVSSVLTIGQRGLNSTYFFNGWIDELRIVKGVAKWTSNFMPPNAPYYGGGDEDEKYRIVCRQISGYAGNSYLYIRPNNDSGSNYGWQQLVGISSSILANRQTSANYLYAGFTGASGEITQSDLLLYSKSGYVRTALVSFPTKVIGT